MYDNGNKFDENGGLKNFKILFVIFDKCESIELITNITNGEHKKELDGGLIPAGKMEIKKIYLHLNF
jgi:hypothetical protein